MWIDGRVYESRLFPFENAKKRFGKSAGVGEKAKKRCSDVSGKVKDVYSNVSDNTQRFGDYDAVRK